MSAATWRRTCADAFARVTGSSLGPYQTAVIRIGLSFTWLFFLVREWFNSQELYGPDAPWSWELARRLIADNHAFTVLMWSGEDWWFKLVYLLAMASALLFMLGWRTRTMSVLYMIGVLSLQNRSVFVGDGGDNVLHLMAIYTVFTRCGQVWSLDARRLAREGRSADDPRRDLAGIVLWAVCGAGLVAATVLADPALTWTDHGPVPGIGWGTALWAVWLLHGVWWLVRLRDGLAGGEVRAVMAAFGHLLHNAALLVIMGEVCLIYGAAGWYKIQGSLWQDGTALYYPLHLDYFSPWPALSHALAASGVVVLLLSYGTVAVQAAFPFTLLNRRVKNALLLLMMVEHVGIAVLLGLPFFSLVMIFADAVFLPTNWLRKAGDLVAGRMRWVASRVPVRVPVQRGGTAAAEEEPMRQQVGAE
ncbi:HTTM domain-containing protein [Streptomyces luteireticuli]|uniref:HTTM domain-containing protein n=1 Tax=Streptomyces luteireticuli TaxID=173858 RepID=A0ABN0YZK8_9ACTN